MQADFDERMMRFVNLGFYFLKSLLPAQRRISPFNFRKPLIQGLACKIALYHAGYDDVITMQFDAPATTSFHSLFFNVSCLSM